MADNHLLVVDLEKEGALSARDVLSGVVRAPWKRPAIRLGLLHGASNIVLVGIARAVLLWHVLALGAGTGKSADGKYPEPELLTAVAMPGRCTLGSAVLGI